MQIHINLKLNIIGINMFLAYYKDMEVRHQIAELSHILINILWPKFF